MIASFIEVRSASFSIALSDSVPTCNFCSCFRNANVHRDAMSLDLTFYHVSVALLPNTKASRWDWLINTYHKTENVDLLCWMP